MGIGATGACADEARGKSLVPAGKKEMGGTKVVRASLDSAGGQVFRGL